MENFVRLKLIENVQNFVNDIRNLGAYVDASHDRYVVDAASILGVLSLDLSKPIKLTLHSNDKEIINKFLDLCSKYNNQ